MLLIYYGIALGLHLVSLAEQGKKIKASTLCDPKSLWQEDHQIIIYASGLDGLSPNARGQHLNNLKFLQVLSDSTKKRSYDEQLRKEESKRVCQRSCGTPQQAGVDHRSEESRCIRCTKCGNSHLWICTNRTKAKARWCQECFLYHPAKDGDGWVEKMPQKVEIPRAFVCAESKVFDVSEWASCQFQILKRQQFMRQQLQNRSRASGFGHGRCGRSSSSFCANPPHHHHQQQQGGSGMRAIFLEGSGSKRESVGTGVFLPRRVGSSTELRRKPACSTVLVPARVVQALNLNLDEMGSAQPRFQGASMTPRSNSNALLSQQMLCIQPHRPSTTTNYEVRLPQEWTY